MSKISENIEGAERLDAYLDALISSLSPEGRQSLLRSLGKTLHAINRKRIAANMTPEGAPMAPRKGKAREKRKTYRIRFLYPNWGEKKWKYREIASASLGSLITGYDLTAGGIRSFDRYRMKIIKTEPHVDARKRKRNRRMFLSLRLARWMKMKADPDSVTVFFAGPAGRIASVHHHGLRDKVSPKAKSSVDYPARHLLGLSPSDKEEMEKIILDHFRDAA
jgi:phage gpG-like protein